MVVAAKTHLHAKSTLPEKLFQKQRYPYFSKDSTALRRPRQVEGGWFVEANLNASLACKLAVALLRRAGLKDAEFDILYVPR